VTTAVTSLVETTGVAEMTGTMSVVASQVDMTSASATMMQNVPSQDVDGGAIQVAAIVRARTKRPTDGGEATSDALLLVEVVAVEVAVEAVVVVEVVAVAVAVEAVKVVGGACLRSGCSLLSALVVPSSSSAIAAHRRSTTSTRSCPTPVAACSKACRQSNYVSIRLTLASRRGSANTLLTARCPGPMTPMRRRDATPRNSHCGSWRRPSL
jgi:hypothetical protein